MNSYGDIYPITHTGRTIACLCALSGASIIGMLISVLLDRYQRIMNEDIDAINEQLLLDENLAEDNNNEGEEEKIFPELPSISKLLGEQADNFKLILNKNIYIFA